MSGFKSLKEFTNEMNAKINSELCPCTYGRCGNGAYFWDFEEMKYYSPYDDEMIYKEERNILVDSNGNLYHWNSVYCNEEVQQSYKAYLVRLIEQVLLT